MTVSVRYREDEVTDLAELWDGDILIIGGGSAGCAAAVAAARQGARTLLIEQGGFLGGTGVALLDTFYGFYAPAATNGSGGESARNSAISSSRAARRSSGPTPTGRAPASPTNPKRSNSPGTGSPLIKAHRCSTTGV